MRNDTVIGPTAAKPRFHPAALSAISLVGGVSLAVIPASTLSIATHIFTTADQGSVSVAITAATFISQLSFAALIESRLSSARTERRVTFPRWLAVVTVLSAAAVAIAFTNVVVLCIALPILLASLEVGRGVSVAERLDLREIWAAALVGVGALTGVIVAYSGASWGFIPLVFGIASASIVRARPVSHRASRPDRAVIGWVLADVAITGIIYPVINTFILLFIGPTQAVLFTAISTASGLLAIPLNFMRLRLLKSHSLLDIWVSASAILLALLAIGILEVTGTLAFIFHGSWTMSATALALGIACIWRAASLASTLPFTALRRGGQVRLLAVLRAACAVATLGGALAALALHSLTVIFTVLLLGELLQAVTYEVARRRVAAARPNEEGR